MTSVLMDLYEVILRPLAIPASIRRWQTAATTFFWSKTSLIGERLRLDAPQVRIDLTAGENHRVIIRSRNLTQCLDLDRSTSVLLVPSLDFAGPKRNDVDFGAGGLKFVAGNLQFGLFKALGGENGYSFVREVAWVIAPGKFPPEPIRRRPDRSLRVEPNAETSKSWARLTGPPAWILPCWIGVTFRWSCLSLHG